MVTILLIIGALFFIVGGFTPILSPEGGGVNPLKFVFWSIGTLMFIIAALVHFFAK
jgi:hypothetical protein